MQNCVRKVFWVSTQRPADIEIIIFQIILTDLGDHLCTYRSVTPSFSQSSYTSSNIVFWALFMTINRAFVLGGYCVFVCGSTGLSFVEARLDFHCRKRQLGMCKGSVGSGLAWSQTHRWPKSQSLFFHWLSCSAHSQAPSLSFSFSPSPPLADEDISSCKQRTKE